MLLKNDGVLPLKTSGTKIAVVGPLAEQTSVLLGNYNGIPDHTVSILEGMKKEFAGATFNYIPGTQFLSKRRKPVPDSVLTFDGKPGVKVNLSQAGHGQPRTAPKPQRPRWPRVSSRASTAAQTPLPAEAASVQPLVDPLGGHAHTARNRRLQPGRRDQTASSASSSTARSVTNAATRGIETKLGRVHLEAGKPDQLLSSTARPTKPRPA